MFKKNVLTRIHYLQITLATSLTNSIFFSSVRKVKKIDKRGRSYKERGSQKLLIGSPAYSLPRSSMFQS